MQGQFKLILNELTIFPWLADLCFIQNKWAASWQNQQSDCAPSEDSDQPGHPPSLIRVFAVCMKKGWILSYPLSSQRRLWSDWVDAQADLSLRWAHSHSVGFVLSWFKSSGFHFFFFFCSSAGPSLEHCRTFSVACKISASLKPKTLLKFLTSYQSCLVIGTWYACIHLIWSA